MSYSVIFECFFSIFLIYAIGSWSDLIFFNWIRIRISNTNLNPLIFRLQNLQNCLKVGTRLSRLPTGPRTSSSCRWPNARSRPRGHSSSATWLTARWAGAPPTGPRSVSCWISGSIGLARFDYPVHSKLECLSLLILPFFYLFLFYLLLFVVSRNL